MGYLNLASVPSATTNDVIVKSKRHLASVNSIIDSDCMTRVYSNSDGIIIMSSSDLIWNSDLYMCG